jgi:hypothetical protein
MLKKLILASLVAACAVSAMALDNITPPAGGGFYDGRVNELARASVSNSIRSAVTAEMTAQADTNSTTTATAYTPRRAGDLLVGSAGTGTNAVWVSKGTTTNDWVQVAP